MKTRLAAAAAAALAAPILLPATQAFAATAPAPASAVSALGSAVAGVMHTTTHHAGSPAVTSATEDMSTSDTVNARGEFPVAPFDETQSLEGEQDIFIQGGDDLGRGAGEVVSAAYLGGPQGILDIPAHVLGFPKPLAYLNEG